MALYRVRADISMGKRTLHRGEIVRGSTFRADAITVLVRRGVLSEVAAPPLAVLPGWKTRAARLRRAGIVSLSDFLEADDAELAKAMRCKPPELATWRTEVEGWLNVAKLPQG